MESTPLPGSAVLSSTQEGRQRRFALRSHPTSLSIKHSSSGVLKLKTFVLVADAGHLLHCKVIFKAQQNSVLWERGF